MREPANAADFEAKKIYKKTYDRHTICCDVSILIQTKRIYEPPTENDGYRILVDRLWPRGISKDKAKLDIWMKEIAPSDELRSWFNHEPEKWEEFQRKYIRELSQKQDLTKQILEQEKQKETVTLIYSAKDTKHNNAIVLKIFLEREKKP